MDRTSHQSTQPMECRPSRDPSLHCSVFWCGTQVGGECRTVTVPYYAYASSLPRGQSLLSTLRHCQHLWWSVQKVKITGYLEGSRKQLRS